MRKTRLDRPVAPYARRALDRARRKTVKTGQRIDMAGPAARHPLRVALKKLRYGVQIFRDLYPKEQRQAYMARMSALQSAFGDVNDAVMAQRLALEAAEAVGPGAARREALRAAGFIAGVYAARAEHAGRAIDDAWRSFEKETPFWRD